MNQLNGTCLIAESKFASRLPGAVTVVIPAFNAQRTIRQTLFAVLAQSMPAAEVIVIDDGSTDLTAELVRSMAPPIRLISQTNTGPAMARNVGIQFARTEFVAFTDSDCVPDPGWLADLLAEFDSPEIAGVGGVVRGIGNGTLGQYFDWSRLLQPVVNAQNKVDFLITANAVFRRSCLVEAGMFCSRFKKPGGEEPDLCRRIRDRGYQLRATSRGLVEHHHKATLAAFCATFANYGEGRFLLAAVYPEYAIPGDPRMSLIRHLLSVRRLLHGVRSRRRSLGMRTAILFSALEHLDRAAGLYGYLRASRSMRRAVKKSARNARGRLQPALSAKGPYAGQ